MNYSLKKQLKMSGATNKNFDKGEIHGVLEHYCHQINCIFEVFHRVFYTPIVMLTSLCSMYFLIGKSMFVGLGFMAFTMFITFRIEDYISKIQREYREKNGRKTNYTTEALANIKTLKFYNWTDTFAKMIKDNRYDGQKLEKLLRKLRLVTGFMWDVLP